MGGVETVISEGELLRSREKLVTIHHRTSSVLVFLEVD